MIQVLIKKNETLTNQAEFESQELADAWLAKHQDNESFGHNDIYEDQDILIQEEITEPVYTQTKEATYDENGNEVEPAQYTITSYRVVQEAIYEVQSVLIVPKEYSIEIVDITNQIAQEAINNESQSFLDSTDWKVLRHIRQKALNVVTTLSEEQYLALEQERSDKANSIVR